MLKPQFCAFISWDLSEMLRIKSLENVLKPIFYIKSSTSFNEKASKILKTTLRTLTRNKINPQLSFQPFYMP